MLNDLDRAMKLRKRNAMMISGIMWNFLIELMLDPSWNSVKLSNTKLRTPVSNELDSMMRLKNW